MSRFICLLARGSELFLMLMLALLIFLFLSGPDPVTKTITQVTTVPWRSNGPGNTILVTSKGSKWFPCNTVSVKYIVTNEHDPIREYSGKTNIVDTGDYSVTIALELDSNTSSGLNYVQAVMNIECPWRDYVVRSQQYAFVLEEK